MERNENLNEMSNDQASSQCLITPRRNLLSKLNITVEPIFFAMFFWFALVDAAGTNIILTRTCTMVFGYSKENCTGEIKPEVTNIIQPYTAKIIMVKSLIEAIFPAILSMFIGSWSDISKRRKPFIIIPLVGSIVEKMLWLLLIYVEAPPLYFILTALPYSLTGGVVGIFTCGYSYISDVSTENNRAFRSFIHLIF
ncbi:hypothetical protein O3M35_008110 [Rhynocoris fuscipes]|uniref:Proton-coupled folate transporter n=1 Tax=Rhynocoris fuscipes TaxID=488301 RepID=A0AAW1DAF8_9HEMI